MGGVNTSNTAMMAPGTPGMYPIMMTPMPSVMVAPPPPGMFAPPLPGYGPDIRACNDGGFVIGSSTVNS